MFSYPHQHPEIRDAVTKLCADFDGKYWQACDADRAYPHKFLQALTNAGYLSALIPEKFGGLSLPISAGAAILEKFTGLAAMRRHVMPRCIPWVRYCGMGQMRKG